MSHAAQSTLSSRGTSGAARIRKIVCRIYGTLAVLFGLAGIALAALVIWIRAMGGSARGFLGKPDGSSLSYDLSLDSVPAFVGPYFLVSSLIIVVLGVLIFRQWVMAAIVLLCFIVVENVLGYFLPGYVVPPLGVDGAASFTLFDAVSYAIMLVLTAVIVIADRAARRVPETQA